MTDTKLRARFLDGIGSRLTEIGETVSTLRSTQNIDETVRKVGRALHTVKGESRLLGLTDITRLCHVGEDVLFSHQRADSISEETEMMLVEALDTVFICAEALRDDEPRPAEDIEDVLERMQASVKPFDESAALPEPSAVEPMKSVEDAVEDATRASSRRSVQLSVQRVDQLTNLAGSISGALVRNRQYIDEILTTAVEARDEAKRRLNADDEQAAEETETVTHCLRALESITAVVQNFREHHFRLDLNYSELSEVVRTARVQPLKTVFGEYASLARRLARPLDKRVTVTLSGEDLGVDQRVLEEIAEPCMHLLNNAIVHGLETRPERRKASKNEDGQINITARPDGALVHIEFSDDGVGVDVDRVRARAIRLGLIDAAEADKLSRNDMAQYIFASGLTTAKEITDIAGRGVGLDVVASVIGSMGGSVRLVSSEPGKGSRFRLTIPVSLSLTRALLIESSGQLFAVPSASVSEVFRLSVKDIFRVEDKEATRYRGRLLVLARLRDALGMRGITDIFVNKVGVLVLRSGEDSAGFIIDHFIGEREIVVRPMGTFVGRPFATSGVTIIEDGRVVVVLHVPDLVQATRRNVAPQRDVSSRKSVTTGERRVLYVEDSVITREYAVGILRAQGLEVTEAGDGLEALEILRSETFDVVLTDLQMPNLDGFGLVAEIRRDPQLSHLPVIVLSTLDTGEAKRMALDAGADAYLVKADFAAGTLIACINQVYR